jgi:hypothetical protein
VLLPLFAAALQAAAPQSVTPPSLPLPAQDEVVVVATRKRCGIAIADRILSSREFNQRSAEWARGVAIRVAVPAGSDYRCLAKIMFRLADRGVIRAEFIDR